MRLDIAKLENMVFICLCTLLSLSLQGLPEQVCNKRESNAPKSFDSLQ